MFKGLKVVFGVIVTVAVAVSGCGSSAVGSSGTSMSCATYNSVNSNASQYVANTNAVSDLLSAHGVNPGGDHHSSAAAGDSVMNVTGRRLRRLTASARRTPTRRSTRVLIGRTSAADHRRPLRLRFKEVAWSIRHVIGGYSKRFYGRPEPATPSVWDHRSVFAIARAIRLE